MRAARATEFTELAGADAALRAIADHAANTAASIIAHSHELAGALYAPRHQYPRARNPDR